MAQATFIKWACALACVLLAACGGDPASSGTPGPKALGERCEQTEDCESLLCVRLDTLGGICSKACENAGECPKADNWDCLGAESSELRVCACLPLADSEVCGNRIDDDCDGQVDDCRSCGGVQVPNDDPANCGACDVACRADQACHDGKCGCQAPYPDACERCTDTQTDSLNCGGCGNVCPAGQACVAGICNCSDPTKPSYCAGSGCVDTTLDGRNCGECGNACELGQACSAGQCVCPAGAPQDFCAGIGCVDFQNDEANCGECGNACGGAQTCVEGECSCPNGLTACGSLCVNPQTDQQNCGECGNACPLVQACVAGECGCVAGVTTVCGDGCANLATDAANCGKCGRQCSEGEICSAGKCTCDSDVYCDDVCMPVGDEQNCGACGSVCPNVQTCVLGACECGGFGLTKCGSTCKDLQYDAQNCGQCGRACRATEQCWGGQCLCEYGQTFCESAGKCVDFSSDEGHCGNCDNACKPTEICWGGSCQCDAVNEQFCASENACVDTQSNEAHCGGCDNACNPTEECSSGQCRCPLAQGLYCASENACVDTWEDEKHCGGCDKACPAQTECFYGNCYCEDGTKTLCDDKCFDLANDAEHCGTCDHACGGNYECQGGACRCPNPSVGAAVRLTTNTLSDARAVAAWDGAHVGVAYLRQIVQGGTFYNLRFALLNPDGTSTLDIELTSYADGTLNGAGWSFGSSAASPQDSLAITFNGSEFAVVWVDRSSQLGDRLRLVRISKAGVASAPVTLADNTNFFGGQRPGVTWSVPYGGYAVSGSIDGQAWFRRVGAQGTVLQDPNSYPTVFGKCESTSIVAAPDGRWGLSCQYSWDGLFGIFNADGSRTQSPVDLDDTVRGSATETAWDGTTFATAYTYADHTVRLFREGAPSKFDLIGPSANESFVANELVIMNGTLALGYASGGTFKLQRFALSTDLAVAPTTFHDVVTVVSTPNVVGRPELVQAGTSKLLAIWHDNRWGGMPELYAAPIDLKACP